MIHFDLPKEKSSILKVIGVGGGGSNAVNHMFNQNIDNVNFIICNTDAQAIAQSNVPNKIQLGPHLTQGLGAGANPEIGKQATEESLDEIKRILEVNTKMAFITAGMGGGTGTGGAPIISKICKDLGILTVGIVTTPFAYEGRKRQLQAEQGIEQMKQFVDTLLVISNDKLRHQFGNLKMKDAFAKADNVLATAAKCITDVINSTGQINVDFADVCTVMRDGGVAILGSATAEGDTRAQKAIEEALNSPLLNDNDIRGAKWILININSAEGDHEFTMDEVEIIQNYLLSHAGQDTDVILGLGYDSTLERKIGITLIATGFQHKTPFYKKDEQAPEPKPEEKIVLTLKSHDDDERNIKKSSVSVIPAEDKLERQPVTETKPVVHFQPEQLTREQIVMMPSLVEAPSDERPAPRSHVATERKEIEKPAPEKAEPIERYELKPELPVNTPAAVVLPSKPAAPSTEPYKSGRTYVSQPQKAEQPVQERNTHFATPPAPAANQPQKAEQPVQERNTHFATPPAPAANQPQKVEPPVQERNTHFATPPAPAATQPQKAEPPVQERKTSSIQPPSPAPTSGGYHTQQPAQSPIQQPLPFNNTAKQPVKPAIPLEEDTIFEMKLVIKEDAPEEPQQAQQPMVLNTLEDLPAEEEVDDQKRRATERIQKLRNLSFNINGTDTNSEFDNVPAYIRRNLELYNTVNNVESFYSSYTVKPDENNKSQISTINTFLDGKKPD